MSTHAGLHGFVSTRRPTRSGGPRFWADRSEAKKIRTRAPNRGSNKKKEQYNIPLFLFIKHETGFEPVSRVGQAGGCAAAAHASKRQRSCRKWGLEFPPTSDT